MKIDYNFILKGIDEKELTGKIEDVHAGKNLGITLCYSAVKSPELSPLKRTIWGQEFYKGNPVEMDDSDLKLLRQFINNQDHGWGPIVVVQLLKVLGDG